MHIAHKFYEGVASHQFYEGGSGTQVECSHPIKAIGSSGLP